MTAAVPFTQRAIIARVNRRLAAEGQQRLCKARPGSRAQAAFGDFYLFDVDTNAVVAHPVELEALARELGCLRPGEAIVD